MANTLMFSVGVELADKKLQELRKELSSNITDIQKGMKLKVELEGVQTIVEQLSKIGNTSSLQNLREEIARLNSQFSLLAKGAGGVGDISMRGVAVEMDIAQRAINRYRNSIEELEKERGRVPNKASDRYKSLTADIESQQRGLRETEERMTQLNERMEYLKKSGTDASAGLKSVDTASSEAKVNAEALTKAISELGGKLSSQNINVTGFENLTAEIGNLVKSIKELVEQFQKLQQMQPNSEKGSAQIHEQTDEYNKQVSAVKQLQKELEIYIRAKERAAENMSSFNNLYPNGVSQPWKLESVQSAIQKDRELQEKTVASLDEKWDAFWAKQEQQANQFAQKLGKSIENVTFDDFRNNVNGQFKDLAKSWYAYFHGEGYEKAFLFDKDHEMQLLERLKELRRLKSVFRDGETFQKNDPEAAAELKLLESLKRRVDEYNAAKNKAFNTDKNASAALDKIYKDERDYNYNRGVYQAAKEKEAAITKEIAEHQKKINDLQSKGAENQKSQGGLFDSNQFSSLRDAIDKIVKETIRLGEALKNLGDNQGLAGLNATIKALQATINSFNGTFKFNASAEEITAYEAKVKSLQQSIKQLEAKAKDLSTSIGNANAGIKTQAEKTGNESTLKDNLQRLSTAIKEVRAEHDRLNESYGQAQTMGMPQNRAIEERLSLLRLLIGEMEKLAKAANTAGSAEADALSKSKAFSLINFSGTNTQLFGKETTKLYKPKEIDAFIKQIEDFVKSEGRMSQTTGSAYTSIANIGTALGQAADRATRAASAFSESEGSLRSYKANVEALKDAYDKTLRGIMSLDERIASGRNAGMDVSHFEKLRDRAQVWADTIREVATNPAYKAFLMQGSDVLKLPNELLNNNVALLGSDWKILMRSIGDTFNQLTKFSGFNKELTLDNTAMANAQKGNEAVRLLENALKDLNRTWNSVGEKATPEIEARVAAQRTAIESLIAQIKGAMTEESRMANRSGLADILGVGYKNTVGYDNTRLIQDIKASASEAERAANAEAKANQKAADEIASANAKKREEINKSWAEQEKMDKKQSAEYEKQMQKDVQAKEQAEQRKRDAAYKAAEQEVKARQKAEEEIIKAANKADEQLIAQKEKTAQAIANSTRKITAAVDQTTRSANGPIESAINRGQDIGLETSALQEKKKKLEENASALKNTSDSEKLNKKAIDDKIRSLRLEREEVERMAKTLNKQAAAAESAKKAGDKKSLKNIQDEAKSVNDASIKYERLSVQIKELEALRDRGIKANIDTSSVDNYIEHLTRLRDLMQEIINNSGRTIKSSLTDSFNLNGGMLASQVLSNKNTQGIKESADVKEFERSLKDVESRMRKAGTEAEKLGKQVDNLEAKRVDFRGLDTSQFDTAVQKIRNIKAELESFARTGTSTRGDSAESIMKTMGLAAVNKEVNDSIKSLNQELKANEKNAQSAASGVVKLTESEQNLANAIRSGTDSMKSQNQVLSDLKMMATQYLSLWGAQSFLNNIIETGGQLEKQRLSIGAILGDVAHANDLFDKIKALAIQSPFGVVELDQMSKQLSAYGFQYNELFDMTKRLADISAATGTSVDRLSLALGHVRSEAALSGYTLRQFSMANIPLAKKLSEHLTEVEKRFVSVAEVRKRVSKKEIGYEDVVNVLKELTNEGGMFYNMQETISQSIASRFKNLKDAMDIMYGDIAESPIGDVLKDLAKILTTLTTEWKTLFYVVGAAGAVFAAAKISILGYNRLLDSHTAGVLKSIDATKRAAKSKLALAQRYRELTPIEQSQLRLSRELTLSDIKTAISTKALTAEQLAKAVAMGKVSKQTAMLAIHQSELTGAERAQMFVTISNTRVLTGLGKAAYAVSAAFQSLKAGFMALVSNPMIWAMAAISALTYLWQKNKEEVDRAKEMNDDLFNRFSESIKNTRKMLEETEITYKVNGIDATREFGDLKGGEWSKKDFNDMDIASVMSIMDKWEQYILEYASMPNTLINKAYKDSDGTIFDLESQYNRLYHKVLQVAEAQRLLKDVATATEYAENATNGGWFNDSLVTNINDYAKAVRKFNDGISDLIRKHQRSVASSLESARANKEFADALKENNIATTDYAAQLKFLYDNIDKYGEAWNSMASDTKNTVADLGRNVKSAMETMDEDLDTWVDAMKQKLGEVWGEVDWDNLTSSQVQAIAHGIAELVAKAGQGTDDIRKKVKELALEKFGIHIDDNIADVAARIAGLKKSLEDITGMPWYIDVGTDFETTYDNVKKAYKKAKEYMDSTKPLMLKFGIEMSVGSAELGEEARQQIVNQWRAENPGQDSTWLEEYLHQLDTYAKHANNAIAFSKYTGLSLEDEKNNNGRGSGDDEAKRLREIAKLYKDAYDWYVKYEKQIGENRSLEKVREQFQPLFDEFNKTWNTNLTLDSINKYRENLIGLLEEAMNLYKTPAHKNSYMVDAIKEFRDAISNVDYEELGRRMDDYASDVQIKIDSLTRSWETFNSVRDATGNIGLAVQLSGVDYQNGKKRNLADALKEKIERDFAGANAISIPFDIDFSDKEIEEKVKNAIPEESEARIKGIVEEYKKWRDLQRDVQKNDVSVFLEAWKDEYDRQQELDNIISQYEKSKESLDSLYRQWLNNEVDANGNRLGITENQYEKALSNLSVASNWEQFKAKNNWKGIVDRADKASIESVQRMVAALREYAKTTKMNAAETYAWYEAMGKLTDRNAVLDPLEGISNAAITYSKALEDRKKAEENLRIARMSKAERKRQGIDDSAVMSVARAEQELEQATQNETTAFENLQRTVDRLVNSLNQLGNALQDIGSSIGGNMGDLLGGFGNIFNSFGRGISAIKDFQKGAKGIAGVMNKVSAVMTVVSAVIEVNKQLANILPNTDGLYERYAEKARQVNKLREAVDDYSLAIAKARKEETEWFAGTSLSALKAEGDKAKDTLMSYYNELYEPQEIYKDKASGFSKWGAVVAGGLAAVAAVAATALTGGAAGVAILGAMTALEATVGTVAATAIGVAIAGGIGAAVGQIAQSAVSGVLYKNGQTSARNNMRLQTRHSTWFRSEKTENLEEWVRRNLNAELFDKEGLVNLEAAQTVLEKYGDKLVGDTQETLERLIELREEYDEFIKKIEDYTGNIGSSLEDNMTEAIWDWLSNGESALDNFRKYASDTWREVAKDIVKTFMKVTVLDKYADAFKDLFKSWSLGGVSDDSLIATITALSGAIAQDFGAALPLAERLAETLNRSFSAYGYDIANGSGGKSSGLSKTIQGTSEETSNLLASYLNATRAYTAQIQELSAEYFPMYYAAMTTGNQSLKNIESHTVAIMRSNDAIMESNAQLYTLFSGLRNGIWKMPVA